ncbi:MAG: hypothetical protein RRC34_16645 [Lentisphaeria bacterium]|nr:hypothetical protein [Lentisphaeria bacterium]
MTIIGMDGLCITPFNGFELARFIANIILLIGIVFGCFASIGLMVALFRIRKAKHPDFSRHCLKFVVGLGLIYWAIAIAYFVLLWTSWWLVAYEGVSKKLIYSRQFSALEWGANFVFCGTFLCFCAGGLLLTDLLGTRIKRKGESLG